MEEIVPICKARCGPSVEVDIVERRVPGHTADRNDVHRSLIFRRTSLAQHVACWVFGCKATHAEVFV